MFLFEKLVEGGWMMFVILGVSILASAITLERLLMLYLRASLNVRDFLGKVTAKIEAQDYRGAMEVCNVKTTHPLPQVIKAGLSKANRREREIERVMEQEMLHSMPRMNRFIGLLGLLGNTATLLGLLGTILGLMEAFSGVSAASAAQRQKVLASGISTAMLTTAFGLIVAVPILFAHQFISGRVDNIMTELEEGASGLLGTLGARMGDLKAAGKSDKA